MIKLFSALSQEQSSASIRRKGMLESVLMASAAALFFISWGVFANWQYGKEAVVQVALTQGMISFFSTFFSSEWLRVLYLSLTRRGINGFLAVPIGAITINTIVFYAHYLTGTPELLLTMLPGAISTCFFCGGVTYRLSRIY